MHRDSAALMSVDNPREVAAQERLIVALDYSDHNEALGLVEKLEGTVSFFKVGYELFLSAGWPIIVKLRAKDLRVMLDLKMDDVEETIERSVRSIARREEASFLTVHGNGATARAAERGKGDHDLKILQITLLTSLDVTDLRELMLVGPDPNRYRFQSEPDYVKYRAGESLKYGCDGLIASGLNAKMLRDSFGKEFTLVCPGIRPKEDVTDDHKRPCAPYQAIIDGADYIVVGRPIRNAADPKAKAERIIEDIQEAMDDRE